MRHNSDGSAGGLQVNARLPVPQLIAVSFGQIVQSNALQKRTMLPVANTQRVAFSSTELELGDRQLTRDVSGELRDAERNIDDIHRGNPLTTLPLPQAVWYALAFCEEALLLRPALQELAGKTLSPNENVLLPDEVRNAAKWLVRWLHRTCSPGKLATYRLTDTTYQASKDLFELSGHYLGVEAAFVYHGLGLVDLTIRGNDIIASGQVMADIVYEVYDRLADRDDQEPANVDLAPLSVRLAPNVRVRGRTFDYPLNRQLVELVLELTDTDLSRRFSLPSEWRLGTYSLGEHARVAGVLWAMSLIHIRARLHAIDKRCQEGGYSRALCLWHPDKLTAQLAAYSGVPRAIVRAVLADMQYAAPGVRDPDIALQPLVAMGPNRIGWAPSLHVYSALERNLLVLLNRFPESRAAYSRLNEARSDLLRLRIESRLGPLGFRFWHGRIGGWPGGLDIDAAIVSDRERQCLCLELKSFIAPSEPREVRDRSEEIGKGINQVIRRKQLSTSHPEPLHRALGIDSTYSLHWAVASETSIGGGWVQNDTVPVVRAAHLLRKFEQLSSLRDVASWLTLREYLPIVGRHYRARDGKVKIGAWTLHWFDWEALVERLP